MIGHDRHVRAVLENLHCKHRQRPLGAHLDEHAAARIVHGLNLLGPLHGRRHLGCEFFKNRWLGRVALHRVKRPVNVGRDGHGGPSNFKPLQESAKRFVGGCDDA